MVDFSEKKWVNGTAPLKSTPTFNGFELLKIPERSVVTSKGMIMNQHEMIMYRTDQREIIGWIYTGWLEDYIETLPKNCVDIPDQTADPRDAEQYFYLSGIKQTNICGEACAAHILGVGVKEVLANWKRAEPKIWASLFDKGKLRGTGYAELISIFRTFERPAVGLTETLRDPKIQRPRYTVTGLKRLLEKGQVISSVSIDNTGRLKPAGILHWIIPQKVTPERAGYGTIEIYNPFPNRVEIYSWAEFFQSAKVPSGVFVPGIDLSS